MPYRIAGTSFTWDPSQETRSQVRKRLHAHLNEELDRIARYHQLRHRVARRRASPVHARNLAIYHAVRQGHATPPELAKVHGLPHERVRDILRATPVWVEEERLLANAVPGRPPPMATPIDDVPGRLFGQRRTSRIDDAP